MIKRHLALAVMGVTLITSFDVLAAGKDGVAATVNGKNISVNDIKVAYNANPIVKEKTSFEDFYEKTLDIFVDGEIVYQAAVEAGTAAATALGEVIATHVIPRPHADVEKLLPAIK